jgi:hypothetical protein
MSVRWQASFSNDPAVLAFAQHLATDDGLCGDEAVNPKP